MKTVVFVWTQEYCNCTITDTSGRHGLGDLLRGTIGILRYCEKRGYECIIDISLHPISKLLLVKPHKYSQFIQENKDTIRLFPQHDAAQAIDEELKGKDFTYFFTPFHLDEFDIPASPYIKEQIRDVLTPNDCLSSYITSMEDEIPFQKFSVIHFRLGDGGIILGKNNQDYTNYINRIRYMDDGKLILMSDSAVLKKLAKPYIFTFDAPIAHVGFHTEEDQIKHTLFEFMLLSKATKIYTHSVYCWTSGFVTIIHYIYDVPLKKI
jgi:hypothetical protein